MAEKVIVFDLDGVITNEECYWVAAGLVLHELLYSPRYWNIDGRKEYHAPQHVEEAKALAESVFPVALIQGLKARAVNSNWDTCYAGFSLYLIDLLSLLPASAREALQPLRPWEEDWNTAFRAALAQVTLPGIGPQRLCSLSDPIFSGYTGFALLDRFNTVAEQRAGLKDVKIFARYSDSWKFVQNIFQEWYLGDTLYQQSYRRKPLQPGKPGCIHDEKPQLPLDQITTALKALRAQGYTLAVCTGRDWQEATTPLKKYDLYQYFDKLHIVTDTQVVEAEQSYREQGYTLSLSKPHPFPFLKAFRPEHRPDAPLPPRGSFIVVGDTPSDVRGAEAANAISIAVYSGVRTEEARALLEQSQPDFLLKDITRVPELVAQFDDLGTIQRLQFTEKAKAELLLQRWFYLHMQLATASVSLTPKATSLNSFNGIYRSNTGEFFFKTHIEDQGILAEYYNAKLLTKAGYHIVRPVRTLHEKDRQMVIYPVVRWPVMFDLMREVETGDTHRATEEILVEAEKRECERLLSIYRDSLQFVSPAEHASAPVHQLFWHRLTGERLKTFYTGKRIPLPRHPESGIPFEELLTYRWRINGGVQPYTLGQLIKRAEVALLPSREAATVVGHGDAHFGNVFLEQQRDYLYFDPAFAGRHSPLLDVIKPLFHNVFATWMYFPFEVEPTCTLQARLDQEEREVVVEYDFTLAPVRLALLQTKLKYLIYPLLDWLRSIDSLPDDWETIIQSALLCCPLLTINLFDPKRMPPLIGWVGLTYAVYMGNNGVFSWKD